MPPGRPGLRAKICDRSSPVTRLALNRPRSLAERIFGYPAAELIGKPVRILIPAERQSEEDEML